MEAVTLSSKTVDREDISLTRVVIGYGGVALLVCVGIFLAQRAERDGALTLTRTVGNREDCVLDALRKILLIVVTNERLIVVLMENRVMNELPILQHLIDKKVT